MRTLTTKIAGALSGATAAFISAGVALAQVGTSTISTTTPGVPSTGVGGDYTTTLVILALTALAVIVGAIYLARRPVREEIN